MVHELVGSNTNRVDLRHVQGIKKEFEEVVLAAHQDPFFRQIMYSNFGDAGMAIKALVDDWSRWVPPPWWAGGATGGQDRQLGACLVFGNASREPIHAFAGAGELKSPRSVFDGQAPYRQLGWQGCDIDCS